MGFDVGRASTPAEIEAVQHLRYSIYVQEMGKYQGRADHTNRRLVDPEDDHSWLFFAREGSRVVGATRITWGGDGFSPRQIEQYSLTPFLDEIPAERMAVGERSMVLPEFRGTNLFDEILAGTVDSFIEHDVRIVFGACEPHLLSVYMGMGQRPYAARNINSEEAGYLIPLVSFVPDAEALRGVGFIATDEAGEPVLPACVEQALKGSSSVISTTMVAPDQYWSEVRAALHEIEAQRISAFDGLTPEEAERSLARSNIIECGAEDKVLKRGGAARNIFVVLDGTLEVRQDDHVVGVLTKGDAFGEMAFLLERPRAFDVYAATDHSRVLSLSEGALRKMIAEDPVVAAKLLLNLSKMLCIRLIKATDGRPLG